MRIAYGLWSLHTLHFVLCCIIPFLLLSIASFVIFVAFHCLICHFCCFPLPHLSFLLLSIASFVIFVAFHCLICHFCCFPLPHFSKLQSVVFVLWVCSICLGISNFHPPAYLIGFSVPLIYRKFSPLSPTSPNDCMHFKRGAYLKGKLRNSGKFSAIYSLFTIFKRMFNY